MGTWTAKMVAATQVSGVIETQVPGVLRIGRSGLSADSLGPWGYIVQRGESAVLVDVPYYSRELAEAVREYAPGGVSHLLLTHDDFVHMSDHARWRRAFPELIRVAHQADAGSVEQILKGGGPWQVGEFEAHHVPGHSAGSVFYSHPELSAVFTGDSMGFWSQPTGFPSHCRFGRDRQAASLRGFARNNFLRAVLPGHGQPMYFEDREGWLEAFLQAARGLDGKRDG
mmetsp:Transcript_63817/g.78039  ORF Transcript_63817/g.78039 Transcript_63817/m.78039 type:complete len:227 (-) Transcript_63817:245-925(-)